MRSNIILITLETFLNVILGQNTPKTHVFRYMVPLNHAYVLIAWAPGPLWTGL